MERAAFGVILINTKSAKPSEKVTINYSNNFAWDQATYLPDYPDVPTQLKMGIEASMNGGAGMLNCSVCISTNCYLTPKSGSNRTAARPATVL